MDHKGLEKSRKICRNGRKRWEIIHLEVHRKSVDVGQQEGRLACKSDSCDWGLAAGKASMQEKIQRGFPEWLKNLTNYFIPVTSRFKPFKNYLYQYTTESRTAMAAAATGVQVSCQVLFDSLVWVTVMSLLPPFPCTALSLTFLQVEIEVPQPCKFIMKTRDCSLSEMSSTRHNRKPVFVKSSSSEDFFFAMNRLALSIPHIMWNTGFNASQNDFFDRCLIPVWNILIFRIYWLWSSLCRGFHLVAKGVTFALQPHISLGMLKPAGHSFSQSLSMLIHIYVLRVYVHDHFPWCQQGMKWEFWDFLDGKTNCYELFRKSVRIRAD